MTKNAYLYEEPFVRDYAKAGHEGLILPTGRLTDFERSDENLIREMILKFMIDREIVKVVSEKIVENPGQNTSSIEWMIHHKNFLSLVDLNEYDDALVILKGESAEFLTEVIDLHARIGMSVDVMVINTLITRIIRSIQIIPYVNDIADIITWDQIHRMSPWMWIIIYMQAIIRTEAAI